MAKKTPAAPAPNMSELAAALVQAIEITKPVAKKTIATRKRNTPWTPKDGSPKLKLKRKMSQHGINLLESRLTNEQIALLNKVRPGTYCDGLVKVRRRRDKGIDLTWPMKTADQRMKLYSAFRVSVLDDILRLVIAEAEAPKKPTFDLDGDAL